MIGKGRRSRYQQGIVDSFMYGWNAYRRWAWGRDELQPISKGYSTWFDLGLTIVDSLDTIWLMNLKDGKKFLQQVLSENDFHALFLIEFKRAKDWVEQMDLAKPRYVNLFEVTIRILGGLLSAHHLSGEQVFLDKAVSVFTLLQTICKQTIL